MSDNGRHERFQEEAERLQDLLTAMEGLSDPTAKSTARELVQVVIDLHRMALSDLLDIVQEAGTQPADTLMARFAANPTVRGTLLLHDLHPEDFETRARKAVEGLRPHLGVQGVRAELCGVENRVVRIKVGASGQNNRRPSAEALREEIEDAVLELAPDADEVIIDGLQATGGSQQAYVAVSQISTSKMSSGQSRAAANNPDR